MEQMMSPLGERTCFSEALEVGGSKARSREFAECPQLCPLEGQAGWPEDARQLTQGGLHRFSEVRPTGLAFRQRDCHRCHAVRAECRSLAGYQRPGAKGTWQGVHLMGR